MKDITIHAFQVYHLDHGADTVELQNIEQEKSDIISYLTNLLEEITSNERCQDYKFVSDTEEVPICVDRILNGELNWKDVSGLKISNRLYRVERETQDRVKGITNINKGSLLIIDCYIGSERKFVLTKVHHDKYLDDEEYSYQLGLPVSKGRLQKSCVITLDDDNKPSNISLSDSNKSIAKYWWHDFLATEPLSSSKINTKRAYDRINQVVSQMIKSESNEDYWLIRNEINSYFSNNQSFVLTDLCDRLSDYKAENDSVQQIIPDLVTKIKGLPDTLSINQRFDTQFDLDVSEIKSKIRRKVILSKEMDLIIKGPIEDLRRKIETGVDVNGKGKFVKIYSDTGYEAFSDVRKDD